MPLVCQYKLAIRFTFTIYCYLFEDFNWMNKNVRCKFFKKLERKFAFSIDKKLN